MSATMSRPAPVRKVPAQARNAGSSTKPSSSRKVRVHLPDGSRSVQSPWVWRGFAMMSLVALGLCLVFAVGHQVYFAISWGTITAGWFGFAMWLWRKHIKYEDAVYESDRNVGKSARR
jgi:hypothetical protein